METWIIKLILDTKNLTFLFGWGKKIKLSSPPLPHFIFDKSALDSPSDLYARQFISAMARKSENGHLTTNREHKKCVQGTVSPREQKKNYINMGVVFSFPRSPENKFILE